MRLMHLFIPDMVERNEGVVFVTSSVGAFQPTVFHTVYGATKAAIQSLAQGIRMELTGTNVSDYLQNVRVEKACSLLRATDMKVTDIAAQVGFKDMKFFYDVFKKIKGKTPGDFRKK